MRTKSIVIAALALLTLAVGCKRKGGGYLAPAPVPAVNTGIELHTFTGKNCTLGVGGEP